MDISFHYFAVKSVARAAGYDEEKAQRIASFSQFIDDYNWYSYFRAGNIPEYIKADELDIVYSKTLNILNPVTTGFYDWVDMATLILPRPQKYTVSAFHFIPQDAQSIAENDNRAVPATLNDGSYISSMLQDLKNDINNNAVNESDALMRMGMLLHTFADTYAHQLFTGYADAVNSVELISATDNITGEDATKKYHFWIEEWLTKLEEIFKITPPTIGHMAIAHVPDLSHLSFEMEYRRADGTVHRHSRSNTSTFVNTCQQLYNYMRDILGSSIPADMEWEELAEKLADGFLIDASEELKKGEADAVEVLVTHWKNIFTNYNFSYNSEEIKASFILAESNDSCTVTIEGEELELFGKEYSDDFYKFNYYADKHLIYLYGEHPRNWLSESETEENMITV